MKHPVLLGLYAMALMPLPLAAAPDLRTAMAIQLDEQPVYDAVRKEFVWGAYLQNTSTLSVSAPIALVLDAIIPNDNSLALVAADGLTPEGTVYQVLLKEGASAVGSKLRVSLRFGMTNPISLLASEAMEKAAIKAYKSALPAKPNFQFNAHLAAIPAGNHQPVAKAELSQNGPVGTALLFDGSTSSDVDQQPLSYNWTVTERPAGSVAQLSNATTAKPSLLADIPGQYTVSLQVSDGYFSSKPNAVTTLVTANGTINHSPVISSMANDLATATRDYSYPISAGDADGDTLTYRLAQAPVGMTISANGLIQWKVPNTPHEHIPVEVKISDGRGGVASQVFSIHILECSCI